MEGVVYALLGILLFLSADGYKQFQSEKEEFAYCLHKLHQVPSPGTTCCNTSVIRPGINVDENWGNCTKDPIDSAETVEKAAWSVYSCILKEKDGVEDSITLKKFSELMTENYPANFKDKIMAEVSTLEDASADLIDMGALNKIRITYFDVEREVCSGMPSASKQYGKAVECKPWDEEIHRGGQCCKSTFYPMDIGLQSYMGMDLTLKFDSCHKKLIEGKALSTDSEVMASAIVEMCDVSCEMIQNAALTPLNLEPGALNSPIDFGAIARSLLPNFLPSGVKDEAVAYALKRFNINQTIEQIDEFEFADTIGGNSSTERAVHSATLVKNETTVVEGKNTVVHQDFMRRRFPNVIKHLPVLCTAHKQILSYLQYYLQREVCEKS